MADDAIARAGELERFQVERWLTLDEAGIAAGVKRRTVYNWIKAGRLEFVRNAGGRIRINPTSLFRPGERPVIMPAK